MLIALAFAHFLSELLLKEQMIIPVKKTLNNAGHIDAKLIDFSEICPINPAKSANCSANFDFFPAKIPRNRLIFPRICPWKSCKILRIFPRNIRSPDNGGKKVTTWSGLQWGYDNFLALGWGSSDKVKLTDVNVITLQQGKMTNSRRTHPVPQLQCVGGTAGCSAFTPRVVQCYNRGSDGYDVQVQSFFSCIIFQTCKPEPCTNVR